MTCHIHSTVPPGVRPPARLAHVDATSCYITVLDDCFIVLPKAVGILFEQQTYSESVKASQEFPDRLLICLSIEPPPSRRGSRESGTSACLYCCRFLETDSFNSCTAGGEPCGLFHSYGIETEVLTQHPSRARKKMPKSNSKVLLTQRDLA